METILYQGRKVRVQEIGQINVRKGEGMDFILRDRRGRYYYRRETYNEVGYYAALENKAAYDYRCHLHRITLDAAILWFVAYSGNDTLRADARARLMAI